MWFLSDLVFLLMNKEVFTYYNITPAKLHIRNDVFIIWDFLEFWTLCFYALHSSNNKQYLSLLLKLLHEK